METRTWSAILPLLYGFRKFALLGIPSLAVLGLAGLAGWRWVRSGGTSSATKLDGDAPKENNNDTLDTASVSKCTPDDASSLASTSFASSDERRTERSDTDKSTVPKPELDGSNGDVQAGRDAERSSVASSDSVVCLKAGPDNGSAVPCDGPGSAVGERSTTPSSRAELVGSEQQRDSERRAPQCSRVQAVVNVPKHLVGRFIGKQGRNVKALRAESGGAYIYVDQCVSGDGPFVPCFVHGEPAQVDEALKLISLKYPNIAVPGDYGGGGGARSRWPGDESSSGYDSGSSPTNQNQNGALECLTNPWVACLAREAPPPSPFHAMVTYIETVRKVWVLPLEATQYLEELHKKMNASYSHTPPLPPACPQANVGTFCAVGIDGNHWLRGIVLQMNQDSQTCDVRLVDYGSCVVVAVSALRPLR